MSEGGVPRPLDLARALLIEPSMLRRNVKIELESTQECARRILLELGSPKGIELDTSLGQVVMEIGERAAGSIKMNGRRLPAGRRLLLSGDSLRYRHHLVDLSALPSPTLLPSGTRTLARAALASPPAALPPHGPFLAVVEGRAVGRRWPLVEGRQIIGRSADTEIVVIDPSVSRRHAEISVRNGLISIRDLGSRHGLRLDRRRLRGERRLRGGEELILGLARLRLVVPERRPVKGGPAIARRRVRGLDWWIAAGALGLLMLGGAISTLALAP